MITPTCTIQWIKHLSLFCLISCIAFQSSFSWVVYKLNILFGVQASHSGSGTLTETVLVNNFCSSVRRRRPTRDLNQRSPTRTPCPNLHPTLPSRWEASAWPAAAMLAGSQGWLRRSVSPVRGGVSTLASLTPGQWFLTVRTATVSEPQTMWKRAWSCSAESCTVQPVCALSAGGKTRSKYMLFLCHWHPDTAPTLNSYHSLNSIQLNFLCIALFTIQDCHKAALQRALAWEPLRASLGRQWQGKTPSLAGRNLEQNQASEGEPSASGRHWADLMV